MTDFPCRKEPCTECPWRTDVPPGKFPPERFRALANTAYDMSRTIFACHMAKEVRPFACAGFMLQSARHNLTYRINVGKTFDPDEIRSDVPLYPSYRAMAIANGVPTDDPSLEACRDD